MHINRLNSRHYPGIASKTNRIELKPIRSLEHVARSSVPNMGNVSNRQSGCTHLGSVLAEGKPPNLLQAVTTLLAATIELTDPLCWCVRQCPMHYRETTLRVSHFRIGWLGGLELPEASKLHQTRWFYWLTGAYILFSTSFSYSVDQDDLFFRWFSRWVQHHPPNHHTSNITSFTII